MHHKKLEEQPALLANTNFLKEKITLMCLTETLFKRIGPNGDRSVPFAEIATASKLPLDQASRACERPPGEPQADDVGCPDPFRWSCCSCVRSHST